MEAGADPRKATGFTTVPSKDELARMLGDPGTRILFYLDHHGEPYGVYLCDDDVQTTFSDEASQQVHAVLSTGRPIVGDISRIALAAKVGLGTKEKRRQINTDDDPLNTKEYYHYFHARNVAEWRALGKEVAVGMVRVGNPAQERHEEFGWEVLREPSGAPHSIYVKGVDSHGKPCLHQCYVLVLDVNSDLQTRIIKTRPELAPEMILTDR